MQVDSKPEELDSIDREIVRLKIEQEALKKESDPGSKERLKRLEGELASLEKQSADLTARWKSEKDKLANAQKLKTELDAAARRARQRAAARRVPARRRAGLWPHPRAGEEAEGRRGQERRRRGRGGGHRRPRRAGGVALDRHSGRPHARRRAREAAQDGGADRQARGRPGRSREGGLDRGAPRPRRPAGPEPADRLVHVPRARPASARPS